MHSKTFFLTSTDTVKLDSLSIIPGSLKINFSENEALDSTFYTINYANAFIIFNQKKIQQNNLVGKKVFLTYRVFPYLFSASLQHKNINSIRPDLFGNYNPFDYDVDKQNTDIDPFKTEGLNKSGSISRGITIGNTQDLSVNSNLNLQLSGHLNNNIDILMAATDNNIPIQPDGNTQQLQQFDQVFVQLTDKRSKLIAGDFILTRPKSYFMVFNKKAEGLSFLTSFPLSGDKKDTTEMMKTAFSAAVSKGKFSRNKISGVDGNQGPYRLSGADNELYIVVLSGTEKVYLDGQLLVRGQDNDYVINYNTAEIYFTPKNVITQDSRIIVEFQYSDQNYVRSLVNFSDEYDTKKLQLRFNAYSEQDSKNQPLQQQLTGQQKQLMASVGDSIQNAITPSVETVAFNNSLVLYAKRDTVIGTVTDTFYVYSTDSTQAHYQLTFSLVGQGKGNYNPITSSANGAVYKWSPPIAGVLQGSYEPVILLITPKKKQMLTLGADYALSKYSHVMVETALSNNDVNTYSTIGKQSDVGYALKVKLNNIVPLSRDTSKNKTKKKDVWNFISSLDYEAVQKNFSPIETYRSTEFDRDWNRTNSTIYNNQNIFGANFGLSNPLQGMINYTFNTFYEGNDYNALKNGLIGNYKYEGFFLSFNGSYLNSKTLIDKTDFLRHYVSISQKIKFLIVGVKEASEVNHFFEKRSDSLQANSYQFFQQEAFISNADTLKNKCTFDYLQRTDYAEKNNFLQKSDFARNFSFNINFMRNANSQFKGTITYRQLTILDTAITVQKPDNTLLGQIQYNFRALKGAITSNSFYQVGSGLEAKQQYTYVQVPAGQGVYTWVDYNGDGIKELNEFPVAAFPDEADYIRIATLTNQYIKTYTNQFSEQFNLRPAALWQAKKGFRKIISLFFDQTAFRISKETTNNNLVTAYNPFAQTTLDTSLVSLTSSFRNTIYFNQLNPIFGMDFGWQSNINKSLLTYGLDAISNNYKELHTRWNITPKWMLSSDFQQGIKLSNSQFFTTNNYQINYFQGTPKISYQPGTVFRISFSFQYSDKQNSVYDGGETAIAQDYSTELKYNVLSTGSFNLKADYINISYNGLQNTSLAFEMLDGLKAGNNVTWGISYQRNLSNNMQLSITYDGRKSDGVKTVNTGGAQVRAFF
ncbi:MAG TPA: hypothetical protein VNG53_04995 [Bacteroidia bacterium]|nr:hypothetical protein [Bacteroidia bacterium]